MKEAVYRRREGVAMQEMDGQLFLAHKDDGTIFHLNAIGAAFWRALESPTDMRSLEDLFVAAFPDQEPGSIRRDIAGLAGELEKNGLIVRQKA